MHVPVHDLASLPRVTESTTRYRVTRNHGTTLPVYMYTSVLPFHFQFPGFLACVAQATFYFHLL